MLKMIKIENLRSDKEAATIDKKGQEWKMLTL